MSMLEPVAVRPKMLANASLAREHLAADAHRERLHCDALEGLASGDYAQAEAFGRQSIDLNPDDLWAIHSVAHVMEMQGRLDEGIAFIDRPVDQWADRNPFQGHNWWHLALFALERGDYDFTLDIYDNRILTSNTEFFLDVQNGASMLKRLELLGVDVGDRWFGIGGSHAQRDIFTQILIEAAIRAERYEQARALLAQRALLRPNSLGSWQKYATVLQACGDDSRAEHARQRAARLHS